MTESEAFKAWAKDYFAGQQRDIACLAWQAATEVERERCAKICDALAHEWRGANSQIVQCADAIRRGEQ